MHPRGLVALARVAPVDREHGAVGAGGEFQSAKERISREEHVGAMAADVAAPRPLKQFLVGAAAVKVPREEMAAILCGPVVAEVDHHPGMGMAATEIVR